MAYDLEEQETLAQAKAWWAKWGTPITVVVTAACLVFAAFNGWRWYQTNQAYEAQSRFVTFQEAVMTHNDKNVKSMAEGIMKDYGQTVYSTLTGLHYAKYALDQGNVEQAKTVLETTLSQETRPEYKTLISLRLATILLDLKKADEALKVLDNTQAVDSQKILVLDRRGDAWMLKGDKQKAREFYQEAQKAVSPASPMARMLNVKLANLPAKQ